jgi:hypothetical protein
MSLLLSQQIHHHLVQNSTVQIQESKQLVVVVVV